MVLPPLSASFEVIFDYFRFENPYASFSELFEHMKKHSEETDAAKLDVTLRWLVTHEFIVYLPSRGVYRSCLRLNGLRRRMWPTKPAVWSPDKYPTVGGLTPHPEPKKPVGPRLDLLLLPPRYS